MSLPPLAFERPDQPLVTVVVTAHNQWPFTYRCLESVLRHQTDVPYIVMVVDDASTDGTAAELAQLVTGVDVVALPDNVGYVRACNAAFARVDTEFVVLLNNDTEVLAGWLDELVQTAREPGVGAVGSKLIYPTGHLQEAGSAIWRDGSGWNLGQGDDPRDPRYNFRASVDYCSAASLLVRMDVLREVGGFDERFAPAYYEDVDLQLAIRARGLDVVYQPRSAVIHHKGLSHGARDENDINRYMDENRKKFTDKWAPVLAGHPTGDPGDVLESVWRRTRGVVLVFDIWVPTWDRDAGSLRMFNLIASLAAAGFGVVFFPFNRYPTEPYVSQLQNMGVRVVHGPYDFGKVLEEFRALAVLALISRPEVAQVCIPAVRRHLPECRIVFDTVDLHFVREARRAEVTGSGEASVAAQEMRSLELRLMAAADVTTVVSTYERDLLAAEAPGIRVELLPLVHEPLASAADSEGRDGVIFVGSFQHPPNADGMQWFLQSVWPEVSAAVPHARLRIVGASPPPMLQSVAARFANVDVLGWVPEIAEVYASSRVSVAPLRYGAGLKGKVGEALAMGVPVVVTPVAAEGLSLVHESSALVAESAHDFAAAVMRALTDDALWARLSAGGIAAARDVLGHDVCVAALEKLTAGVSRPGEVAPVPIEIELARMSTIDGPPSYLDPNSPDFIAAAGRYTRAQQATATVAHRVSALFDRHPGARRLLLPPGSTRESWARSVYQARVSRRRVPERDG